MNICPVCGYSKLDKKPYENIDQFTSEEIAGFEPPYEPMLGKASYEICPQCGFEFGNDDNPGTAKPDSFSQYRARWESEGSKWFSSINSEE
jgi:rubredoxin